MATTFKDLNTTVPDVKYQIIDSTENNEWDNYTDPMQQQQQVNPITTFIEQYYIPTVCFFGLTGNTLASIVFLRKAMRNSSCSIFLVSRSFSDNGFLLTLLIIWLSRTLELNLGTVNGTCRIIVFISYVCGLLSVWLVVFVTVENYIRICKPFMVNYICKTRTAKIVVLFTVIIAVGIYNFPFWAMNGTSCQPYPEHMNFVQGFVYADTIISLLIPLICITCFMTAIVCDLVKSFNRRSRLYAPTLKRVKNPMAEVTKMLFAVSLSFFSLNLPSHICRLRLMIISLSSESKYPSTMDQTIQQVTLALSYLSLSINILVYLMFGSKFRKTLKDSVTRVHTIHSVDILELHSNDNKHLCTDQHIARDFKTMEITLTDTCMNDTSIMSSRVVSNVKTYIR